MKRRRYKFIGRDGAQYVWQSVEHVRGDSRVEEIRCSVRWFWTLCGGGIDRTVTTVPHGSP